MKPVPMMILSDAPDSHSGLGRITRDLAVQVAKLPEFRVATMGRGGRGTSKLPFMQYCFGDAQGHGDGWGEGRLEECWRDFAGNERGVLFTIYDASRLRWLVSPDELIDQGLVKFLNSCPFERWGYFPIDSTGPNNRLTGYIADTIKRFDRVLAYGLWGSEVISQSIGREVEWIPHGVNFNAFQPRDRVGSRLALGIREGEVLIGMNATNQTRKDWGLALCLFDQLRKQRGGLRFWVHIDEMVRHWNLHALIHDYGLSDVVKVTIHGSLSDKELSWHYGACDLTILPSSEGFGYPIVESLACGVPVIHSRYAGGAELVPNLDWLVEPVTYRLDSQWNCLRPVWEVQDWVNAVIAALDNPWSAGECRRSIDHLDWVNLGPVWAKWMRKGIGITHEPDQANTRSQNA